MDEPGDAEGNLESEPIKRKERRSHELPLGLITRCKQPWVAPVLQDLLLFLMAQRTSKLRFPVFDLRPEILAQLADHVVLLPHRQEAAHGVEMAIEKIHDASLFSPRV